MSLIHSIKCRGSLFSDLWSLVSMYVYCVFYCVALECFIIIWRYEVRVSSHHPGIVIAGLSCWELGTA